MTPIWTQDVTFYILRYLEVEHGTVAYVVFQKALLFVEDAGLLEGVLALGYVPHPDRPVITAGSQQAFLAAPSTRDDLSETY